ncbi:AAA family ATPase [Streptomyces sp. MZ04]|uniref:AAA family ATPase n=1 Tax=Streptomyces sp. MZ04 TaxID=2559236 RepID=UPI00107E982A|nr:AAA family ATPase [Streptomyces sp. MZ04]TGA92471.1 AAA family ATPase [Streptomyces sp. MZ04]
MSNYAESLHHLDSYISARVPVIGMRTIEQQRALRLLREAATQPRRSSMPFWIYTRATGLRDLRTNVSVQDDRSLTGAMDFAAAQFTSRANATVILVDPDGLEADTPVTRHVAELARLADSNMGSIILITDTPIWSGLQRLGMSLQLDLPDADEMYGILSGFLGDHHGHIPIEWGEEDARRAAEFLRGVTEAECVNLMATIAAKGSIKEEDVLGLAQAKDRIFSDLTGLERVALRESDYSIGGLSSLREWLRRKHELMHADLRGSELRPPRGVLLVGVPGCGKSLSAKAIAHEWKLPLYRLDMGSIHGKYLGESEGRFREALAMADRVAPCILWIDEIEKGLAGRDDGTGVPQRIIGQFLFWLQESQSRAFVVATANDVRSLPPELLRKGRFDELFFVDLPDADERKEIIALYHRRYLKSDPEPQQVDRLVDLSEGFAGSDLESALHDVGAEALLSGGAANLKPSLLLDTFANTVPMSRVNPEQIEEIRAWGRERAVPAGRASSTAAPGAAKPARRIVFMDD